MAEATTIYVELLDEGIKVGTAESTSPARRWSNGHSSSGAVALIRERQRSQTCG